MLNHIYSALVENMDTKQRDELDDSLVERDPEFERARRLALVRRMGGEMAAG